MGMTLAVSLMLSQVVPGDPTWVLLFYKGNDNSKAMLSQEFLSEERCKTAGNAFAAALNSVFGQTSYVCVKK